MAGEKMSSLDKDTVLLLNKGKCCLFHLAFGRTAVIIVLLALQVALLFFGFFRLGKYIYYGGSMLLSLVVALMVVNKPGNPAGKITWILLIMLFPVFAALFYLYVETELGHRLAKRRLEEMEGLLDELFLYTRLLGGALPLACGKTEALPPLWDALAECYPQLETAGIQPELRFAAEAMPVWASPEALGRIYRNLVVNALRHGGGGLTVSAKDGGVCFSNPLGPGPRPDPDHLFDRFYQSSPARGKGGAGLGLSIVRELMEQMGGRVSAQIVGDTLQILLVFAQDAPSDR